MIRRIRYALLVCLGLFWLGPVPALAADWEVYVPDSEEVELPSLRSVAVYNDALAVADLYDEEAQEDEEDEEDDEEDDSYDDDVELINDLGGEVATPANASLYSADVATASNVALDSNDGIMLLSSYTPDEYSISTSVLAYFDDYVQRLVGKHYVFWRSGDYSYRLVYGDNLDVSGSSFSGSDCYYVAYNSRYYTWESGYEGDFNLEAGSYLVYSDLGEYPMLGADSVASWVVAFVAVCYLLFVIFRSFFAPQSFRLG